MTFVPTLSRSLMSHGGNDKHDPTIQTYVAAPLAFHATQDPISGTQVPAIGRKSGGNGVMDAIGVRRLTPRECERLQGLPDDWTKLDDKTPDSRRYSALGDAVTANVAEWIGGRLLAA